MFTVTSYVDDPDFWADNVEKGTESFINTITMARNGTEVSGVPIAADKQAAAMTSPGNTVFRKMSVGYDPKNKKMVWQLIVNESQGDLGTVRIEEILPAGMTCTEADRGKALVNGKPFSEENGSTFSVIDGETILIRMEHVQEKTEITFPVSVNVDIDKLRTREKLIFDNYAKLHSSKRGEEAYTPAESSVTIRNQILQKSSEFLPDDNIAHYTVVVNPLGIDLAAVEHTDNICIYEQLDTGLYVDLESIRLYEAEVKAERAGEVYTVRADKKTEIFIPDGQVEYDFSSNTFQIPIPDVSRAYILEYTAFVMRSGVPLNNHVNIKGNDVLKKAGNGSDSSSVLARGFGGGNLSLPQGFRNSYYIVQIRKVDRANQEEVVGGAVFGLYRGDSFEFGEPLVVGESDDSTGVCVLAVPKKQVRNGETLYWHELKAPDGYKLYDRWIAVTVTLPQSDEDLIPFICMNAREGEPDVWDPPVESDESREEPSESEPESDSEDGADTEPSREPESEPESKPDTEPEGEPDTELESEPDTESKSEPDTGTETESDTEVGNGSETKADMEQENTSDTATDGKPEGEPDPEKESKLESGLKWPDNIPGRKQDGYLENWQYGVWDTGQNQDSGIESEPEYSQYQNHDTAQAPIKDDGSEVPRTEDRSHLFVWFSLFVMSAAVMFRMIFEKWSKRKP